MGAFFDDFEKAFRSEQSLGEGGRDEFPVVWLAVLCLWSYRFAVAAILKSIACENVTMSFLFRLPLGSGARL